MEELLQSLVSAIRGTALHLFVRQSVWLWPILESVHFLGMSLLVGAIGVFDLRLLGFARGIPAAALHRLIPIGIAGFGLNALTGLVFIAGYPEQYLFNAAFRVKVAFIALAGVNVLFFYTRVFHRLAALAPDEPAPAAARVVGGVSLALWIGVMTAGRLLTFFRPPF